MKTYVMIMAGLLVCACAHRYEGPSYYSLGSDVNGRAISAKKMSVDVGRVKIPEYIDRPQMVTTDGVNVTVVQDSRWAENLSPMLGRRIMDGIRTRMTGASVKNVDFIGAPADYTVFVEIYRFDGSVPGVVRLDAAYSINDSAGETVRARHVNYEDASDDGYDDYARKLGGLVDRLSRDISRDLDKFAK